MVAPNCAYSVTFNKQTIREKITNFSINEARRLKKHIYAALVQELYEHGCIKAADNLKCLAKKERRLINSNLIRIPLYLKPDLLFSLFENIKAAEQKAQSNTCNSKADALQLLLQCLELLESQGQTFDWLLQHLYTFFADISDKLSEPNDTAMQMKARIYCKYGVYLALKNIDADEAVLYLEKSLNLSRSHTWYSLDSSLPSSSQVQETLHQNIVQKLGEHLLNYANKLANSNTLKALKLTEKALLINGEVKYIEGDYFSCRAQLMQSRLLLLMENYSKALRILEQVHKKILLTGKWEYTMLYCECMLYKGMCFSSLNNNSRAQSVLRQALLLSRKIGSQKFEAMTCFQLGKLHANHTNERSAAKIYFENAKKLYGNQGQSDHQLKVIYQLAKLELDHFFPLFMDLLKHKEERHCNIYKIRQWKNSCQPFWTTSTGDRDDESSSNMVQCLLNANSVESLHEVTSEVLGSRSELKCNYRSNL